MYKRAIIGWIKTDTGSTSEYFIYPTMATDPDLGFSQLLTAKVLILYR